MSYDATNQAQQAIASGDREQLVNALDAGARLALEQDPAKVALGWKLIKDLLGATATLEMQDGEGRDFAARLECIGKETPLVGYSVVAGSILYFGREERAKDLLNDIQRWLAAGDVSDSLQTGRPARRGPHL